MRFLIVLISSVLLASVGNCQQYNWRYQSSADCSALTIGKFADLCFQTTDQKVFKCVPSGGADTTCDAPAEWQVVVGEELDTLNSVLARGSSSSIMPTFSSGITTDAVQFDITDTPKADAVGQLQWNATDGTLDLGMSGATQQIGQELFQKVVNKTGSPIANGSAVYGCGRQGNREKVCLARSDAEATSKVLGITTQDIADNAEGFITTFGFVRQIKTDYAGWAENDLLYVSKTTAGALTDVEPSAPHHSDVVGKVAIVGGAGIGAIAISIERHKTLEELSDINGTPLTTTGQFPVWNATSGFFDFNRNTSEFLTDAPSDGKTYGRKDGIWSEASSASGGSDGNIQYNNNGELGGDDRFTFNDVDGSIYIGGKVSIGASDTYLQKVGNTLKLYVGNSVRQEWTTTSGSVAEYIVFDAESVVFDGERITEEL